MSDNPGKPSNVTVLWDDNVKYRNGRATRKLEGLAGVPAGKRVEMFKDRFVPGGALFAGNVIVSLYPSSEGNGIAFPIVLSGTEASTDCGDSGWVRGY